MDREVAEAAMAEAITEEEEDGVSLIPNRGSQPERLSKWISYFLFLSGLGGKDDDDVDPISEFCHFCPFAF